MNKEIGSFCLAQKKFWLTRLTPWGGVVVLGDCLIISDGVKIFGSHWVSKLEEV